MEKKFVPMNWGRGGLLLGCVHWGDCEAFSGAADVDRRQSNEQSQRGHNLEVDEALDTDSSDAAQIAMGSNSGDQCSKNQRRNDDLEQPQKNVAEDLQVLGELWPRQSNLTAQKQGEENPSRQRPTSDPPKSQHCEASPPHCRRPNLRREHRLEKRARKHKGHSENE